MIERGRDRSGGFSLVELLVVMAIVAIVMGISIPILQMFSQNDMDRGARSLYTMIRSARVYAQTFNVTTAIVYQLDEDPVNNPVHDTLRDQSVRIIRGATVLYQLPSNVGQSYKGLYVPAANYTAEFEPFPQGYAVLLDVPPSDYRLPPGSVAYPHDVSQPGDHSAYEPLVSNQNIGLLGMQSVEMYNAYIDPDPAVRQAEYDPTAKMLLLAHVFDNGGKLVVGSNATTQRFSILFAPSPDRPAAERTWTAVDLNDLNISAWLQKNPITPEAEPQMGLIGIPIEIYRSTGRVRMGSL